MRIRFKANKHRRSAFTLVEVIAAMAIMIFVALIIGTASMTFYNAWRRTTKAAKTLKTYQRIDRIMDGCVKNMIPFQWLDTATNQQRFIFQGENDKVHFVTLRRSYRGDKGALLFLRLKVENEQLTAEYSSYPRPHWEEEGKYPLEKEIIADQVRTIRFQYAHKNSSDEIEWNDQWTEYDEQTLQTNPNATTIPLAIQMSVEWLDGSKEVWLRRTAGAAANTRMGTSMP